MSHPSLFQLSGLGYPPAGLNNATLLIIDAQEEYRSGDLALPGLQPALAEIATLLERARAAGTPVVHVRHLGIPGGLFDPEGPRGAILAELTPTANETVVTKRLPNAFAGTELHPLLGELGRRDLIVCGFMSHMCVSSTVRVAKDLGYRCTLVDSACATRPLVGLDGVMDATILHRAAMTALADNFAVIVPTADDLPA